MLKQWYERLFTQEDPTHLHKTLGILCILSYVYRYYIFLVYGTFGFTSFSGPATILLHCALSFSSLIFHVISKRMLNRAMIIWEEYRLHAIVFTMRSCCIFFFGTSNVLSNATIVLMHHLLADEVTHRYGPENKEYTTVRVQDDHSLKTTLVLRFYSFYQFAAIASHLFTISPKEMGFNTLIAIQSSAFLMTLYRKNLITSYTHGLVYGTCLILSLYVMSTVMPGWVWMGTALVFGARVGLGVNKYVLWGAFVLIAKLKNVRCIVF